MCGIIASIGKNTKNNIIEGLKQLQNRGYDSAGISLIHKNQWHTKKYASKPNRDSIEMLEETIYPESFNGIGHTRWATHGCKNDINSHPHMSSDGKIMIVHNGIIENYKELKDTLIQKGYSFVSETDSEVISNLIAYNYNVYETIEKALKHTLSEMEGTWGLCIQCIDNPDTIYCTKHGSPLLIGLCETFALITSEQSGFCNNLNNYLEVEHDDICKISYINNIIHINTDKTYKLREVEKNFIEELKENHWTLKEIKEQNDIVKKVTNNGSRIINNKEIYLGGLLKYKEELKKCEHIILLGCGTSYYSSCIGRNYFKNFTNLNTIQVFDGAEFNEDDIPKKGKCVIIFVSQSGETKDLQRCIDIVKNHIKIGIINVVDSYIARNVDCGCYLNIGREIGVASTKSFTAQVIMLSMVALWFSQLEAGIHNCHEKIINDLKRLPRQIERSIHKYENNENNEKIISLINNNCFILGKGNDEYIAKEGALKIKEMSYIHAEGYSSGCLKHGPFALLNNNFTVLLINSEKKYKQKNENIYQEISSRGSPIIVITDTNEDKPYELLVETNNTYQCILNIIPIQLLSYYLSIKRGYNPDKPRNLAKVVTVE